MVPIENSAGHIWVTGGKFEGFGQFGRYNKVIRNPRIVKLEVENTIFRMTDAALPKWNPGLFSSSPTDKIDKSIENFEIS